VEFLFPVVLCDVGGTNCRIAVKPWPDQPSRVVALLKTADFEGLAEAVASAAATQGFVPRSVIACGAGPVDGRHLKLTNAPWVIDGPAVAAKLGLHQGLLLNDFEAQALSLPALQSDWVRRIGPEIPHDNGPHAILGPGTGLGIACLVAADGRFMALPSEACHIGFAPETEEETAFWPHLERAHGRITTESVLSGVGLERVHRARLAALGRPVAAESAAEITATALARRDSEEAATVATYWRLIGRFAGDMAITYKATGGVTLAGGILPRIIDLVDPLQFRAAFEAKAPVEALARRIPTQLITHGESVLEGMGAIAADPKRYALDYDHLAWC
jgi:glucokinase